ncbi:hypothetical protein K501DRAFT_329903 [Backusella circina FSU 941]|nr:hypothetical protein K501DRAFT_329903 [Backusella circina FSU 941]
MTEANIGSSVSTVVLSNTQDQEPKDNKKLNRGTYQTWKNDQNEEGKTSLDTIVDWLAQGENYSKYKGSLKTPGESNKKTAYCKTIAEILVATGHTHRDFKGIMSQISELETKFKAGVKELNKCASANNLGNIDINANHDETIIDEKGYRRPLKDVVKKKFKYFYILRPMFTKWEDNLDIGSAEPTSHELSASPSISKRQRDHEEQFFDASDTEIRGDAQLQTNDIPLSARVIDLENGNHVNHIANNDKVIAIDNNNNNTGNHHHTPIFPTFNHRASSQYPSQQGNQIAYNDSEQARKKQRKLQKHQAEERFSQSLNSLMEEQKETVVRTRTTGDKQLLLEEEHLLLEKQKLVLEERRIALEEKREERLAFFGSLEKLKHDDPRYSELLSLFMKKQLSYGDDELE